LRGAALIGGTAALQAWTPVWAQTVSPGITAPLPSLEGADITLRIARQTMMIDGRASKAIGINGTVPAPLLRLKEGQKVRLHVINDLDEDSSLHWHGLLVPPDQDGVPGVSYPGIRARTTFSYEFTLRQSGTYWYHSHSGTQEQAGLYGPIVIDPAGADPVAYDREHVIVLSDHSFMSPDLILARLKQQPGYFDYQQQTLAGLLAGRDQTQKQRLQWGRMRMDPTDISDVTGATYAYLVNGHGPYDNWTALFTPGQRMRLRIVNASSMTTFNVRIPGLSLTIVQADGQNVRPVETDEFQIGVAETYDLIVSPPDDRAYTLVGEAVDRSGMARATLAPRAGMTAPVPPLRKRPVATMKDMGMDMGGMDMSGGMGRGVDTTAEQNASRLLASARAHGTEQAEHRGHGHADGRDARHVGHGRNGPWLHGSRGASWHGRHERHGHVVDEHARLLEGAARQERRRRADDRANADGPDRRAGSRAREYRPPRADLPRPGCARGQPRHARAVAVDRRPPHRQHGTVHVVDRWGEDVRHDDADPLALRRARAGQSH